MLAYFSFNKLLTNLENHNLISIIIRTNEVKKNAILVFNNTIQLLQLREYNILS